LLYNEKFPVPEPPAVSSAIEIRQLSELPEFSEVVRLQRQIWGFEDIDLLPLRLFVVASKIGGQVLGAFDAGKMVAFCLCIPGLKPGGKFYLHSHMLGVLPEYRNTGLGRKLKLEQRLYALAGEVDLIEWTFDPLEIKNAFFNIERLGAVVRRYVHNQYGMTTSHLHGGLPTDRLVPEWWIGSQRVEDLLRRGRLQDRIAPEARIAVPATISELRLTELERARDIQASLAEQFDEHFRAGLAVIGFERSDQAGTYLLGQFS
jgi:predicted GNAT superfamily acetyltransferase